MAQLLELADFRYARRGKSLYFGRQDLNQLLAIYAGQVARGFFRDYAIDHLTDRVVFSLFKRSQDVPLFQITKYRPKHGPIRYALSSRAKQLKSSIELDDILETLKDLLDHLS